jgi:hypothetical protein
LGSFGDARVKTLSFIIFALGLFSSVSACRADTWQRADIYFIDWDVLTRARLTPERVRELADSKRTFRREAPEIARSLALDKLKLTKDKQPEDARLVIDLFTATGARITYYASRFSLCTADSTFKRPIDEQFRQRFKRLSR